MKRKLIIAIAVVFVAISIFVGFNLFRFRGVSSAEKHTAFSIASSFGEELQELSKNGSISIDSKTIREKFGLLLTQRLLIEWMDDPKDLFTLINSTYSPSKIEISSLEKIDTSTIKLKGKIMWVNKTNNRLIKKEPVVMLLKRKDPEEQYSLVIHKIYVAPYTGDYEKKVFCLNETTSDIIAIYEVGDVVTTAPLVYDGKVYVVAEDGYLYCFKEE